jgi:group I intron endonuclease
MKVYCIENKIDGKKYVGITRGEIERRFKQHKTITKTKNDSNKSHIHNAMALYGIENFIVYELDYAETKEELFEKEKHWIKKLDTKNNGYNETDGGEGTFGWKPTEEQRKQNSERIKKVMENEEHKKLLSEKSKNYWNNLDEEERNRRKKQFLEAREKIYRTASKGKHWNLSNETKQKISFAKKGKKASEETRKKLSEIAKCRTGRKHSPETKEKMRLSALNRKLGN